MLTVDLRTLYRIDTARGATAVFLRVALAVGVPLIGGELIGDRTAGVTGGVTALFVTLCDIGTTEANRCRMMTIGFLAVVGGGTAGHLLGGSGFVDEWIVLVSAFIAGWASAGHAGIAAAVRFFALAVAAGTGMHYATPALGWGVVTGGVTALSAAIISWRLFGLPPSDNVMDWRAGVRRAFSGVDTGPRFALCYGAAAAVALFAASWLGVGAPYWATIVVLMVMRREGTVSLILTLHYAAGTLVGVGIAVALLRFVSDPFLVAALATASAALARVAFAMNPALGFACFNVFLLSVVHLTSAGSLEHLSGERIYDVAVGCVLAIAATLLVRYPRLALNRRNDYPSK